MNKDVKELWLTALRSGEYEQGHGNLRNGDKFCCLGVLCDLAVKHSGLPIEVMLANGRLMGYDECFIYPPTSVIIWSGIESFNGRFTVNGKEDFLDVLNDSEFSFAQIADVIEREF